MLVTPYVDDVQAGAETGIPVCDPIATVVWKSLQLAGADTALIQGWGQLFREVV